MPPRGLEPAIPAGERPQTHALDRAATGIGRHSLQRQNMGKYISYVSLSHNIHTVLDFRKQIWYFQNKQFTFLHLSSVACISRTQ